MNTPDLRDYLSFAEGKGKSAWLSIDKPISARWETTAVVEGMARKLRSPVIRFNQVDDCDYSMVTNICASLDRVAKSVGLSVDELNQRFVTAHQAGLNAETVDAEAAPVCANQHARGAFSLFDFPHLIYTETQSAPYITSAIVIGRDPDSGAHNFSFHRLMMIDDHRAAIYMTPGGHLDQIWRKYSTTGQPAPIAAAIGTHPLWCYAALIAGALEDEDYTTTSGVLGASLPVVASSVDPELLVPAQAELVLEGFIEPEATAPEGPFGEFLGYVADVADRPIVRFETLRHRNEPIYQDIVAGQVEHLTMSSISLRARLQRDYFEAHPEVLEFWLPAPMTIFFKVDSEHHPDFDALALMQSLLQNEAYLKQAYCFDADIDLRKQASVQSAIACFAQPAADITVFDNLGGNGVDPSESDGRTSKLMIDARAKASVTRSTLPTEFVDAFDLNAFIR
ncbi:MAG: UbiD family decarboxylase [Pseudomonadota bacterium]